MPIDANTPRGRRLVAAPQLLELLFEPESRPGLRTLREWQRKKLVPFFRIGRLVRFDPEMVRASLEQRNLIQNRRA